eukprot:TRINITY_DN42789_c0_g1_i1.p2 TRINITY_DN42789_c0_g1~~TRINITY_DN42789_c0_g1_i1.p2  ORF type:complete len:238 (+),score=93.50 TRINITY_DN42789_c0_g1_i1:96-809(+)
MPTGECKVCFARAELVTFGEDCACKSCSDCARKHIKTEMAEGKFNFGGELVIRCMCRKVIPPTRLHELARTEDKDRYEYLAAKRCIEAMDDFMYCRWPNCGSGQLHDGGSDAPIMTCHNCKKKVCFNCNVKWHHGETCKDFCDRRNLWAAEGFETTEELLDGVSSKCPSCGVRVEKDGLGTSREQCDHMTCLACKHEFCWRCLCDMKKVFQHGNHYHKTGCRHYFAYAGRGAAAEQQ